MLPFLRPTLRDGWLAVARAADRIDLAHVRRRPGARPEVLLLHSRVCDGDELAGLRALRRDLRLGRHRCTALLRHGEYQLLQVEPPDVPEEELREALRWRVKDMLGFAAEVAAIDLLDIPQAPGGMGRRQVFVMAADKGLLTPRVAAFDDARLQLEAIDVTELAQRNIAALFEEEHRGLALLCFDDSGGTLSFTCAGELYAVRHIDASLAQFFSPDVAQREALFERVALEAQRSLDNFDRQFGHISLSRLLVSPLPESSVFLHYLRENLALPVGELDLAEALDFPAVPDLALASTQAAFLMVLGAALRDAAA